jgi:MazG family protein
MEGAGLTTVYHAVEHTSLLFLPASMSDEHQFGIPPNDQLEPAFRELCDVVAKLRSPDGCPWDREQTLETIKPYTLEETYELLEAIDSGDDEAIVEELGDVLLQVLLDAQIGSDEQRFNLLDVVQRLKTKLITRHPHVFGDATAATAEDVKPLWDAAKKSEKRNRESVLEGIPKDLPQLARAKRITARAARVGYDFPDRCMLFDKLNEELNELAAELFEDGKIPQVSAGVDSPHIDDQPITDAARKQRVEDELGDVLFVLANIARRWDINPEEALRNSNRKFSRRFQAIEKSLAETDRDIESASLVEMEEIYQANKRREKTA